MEDQLVPSGTAACVHGRCGHMGVWSERVCQGGEKGGRGGKGGGTWAVSWTAILATASSACQTERSGETAKPAPSGSVRYGGVLDCGMATELPGRALGVHQAAVVRVQEGLPCDHLRKSVRACITAWSCAAVRLMVGLCRTATSDGVRRGDAPRWRRQSPAPAGGKTSRLDPSDDCVGSEWRAE